MSGPFIFADNILTTLTSAITNSATTITLASSANLPSSIPAGYYFVISMNDIATHSVFEVMYATAISGTTLTVIRGQEGTTASAWGTTDIAYHGITAGQMAYLQGQASVATGAYLQYVSSTQIEIVPAGGALLWINGVNYPVITTTLSNSGLAASTLYYIYASISGGVIVLTASTTSYTKATNGVPQLTGNAAYTLVGMAVTGTFSQFQTQGTGTVSYFNRKNIGLTVVYLSSLTATISSSSTIASGLFISWGDDGIIGEVQGTVQSTTANVLAALQLWVDGAAGPNQGNTETALALANTNYSQTANAMGLVSEGTHTGRIVAVAYPGTYTWSVVTLNMTVRG